MASVSLSFKHNTINQYISNFINPTGQLDESSMFEGYK